MHSGSNWCHQNVVNHLNYYNYAHWQVIAEREGKKVDGKCLGLTASYVRLRHKEDKSVPVCPFYEVKLLLNYIILKGLWSLT